MSRAAGVVGGVLGVVLAGTVATVVAVNQHWGPWTTAAPRQETLGPSTLAASGVLTLRPAPCPGFTVPDLDAFDEGKVSTRPQDAWYVVFPDRGTVLASCMGSVQDLGMPVDFARDKESTDVVRWADQTAPVVLHGDFGDAVRWSGTSVTQDGEPIMRLTDWYVVRDGWVIGFGYLQRDGSADRTAMVQDMVAGLVWG